MAQRPPIGRQPSIFAPEPEPPAPAAVTVTVPPEVVSKPKGHAKDFTIAWVPNHLKGMGGSFTSTVRSINEDDAIRFLRAACSPCDITIEAVDVKP